MKTAVEWLNGAEVTDACRRRTTITLQLLERYVGNHHARASIVVAVRDAIHLLMTDAYEAGMRDGARPVRDALDAIGLPESAGVDGLITHHRANAKLSGTFDALALKNVKWIHGTRLGREHTSVRQHLVEDHGVDPAQVAEWSDGAAHGEHDGLHNATWAYAADLPHK